MVIYAVAGEIPGELRSMLQDMGFNPPPSSGEPEVPALCDFTGGVESGEGEDTDGDRREGGCAFCDHRSRVVEMLRAELLDKEQETALRGIDFDGRTAMIGGLCQMGKSGEIALAACLSTTAR